MSIFKRKDIPGIDTMLKRVAPKNRKRSVIVVSAESVTPNDTTWDGGTRYSYHACLLDGRQVSYVPAPTAPAHFGGGEAVAFAIEPGHAVVKLGTFCGKTATPTVYIHPCDVIQCQVSEEVNHDGS